MEASLIGYVKDAKLRGRARTGSVHLSPTIGSTYIRSSVDDTKGSYKQSQTLVAPSI